ncbi:MAG: response regulator [Bacteroidota bacterium]
MYNVLIADDDVDSWFQVSALLRKYLIKASFVTNFNAARQHIDKQMPSLLFFDKQLQDHSALEFIRYVKAKYPEAKLIMINNYGERSMGFKSKADLTISKPLIPDIIERAIVKLLYPQLQAFAPA